MVNWRQGLIKGLKAWSFFRNYRVKIRVGIFLVLLITSFALSGWTGGTQGVRIPILGFHDIIDTNNSQDLPPQRLSFATDYSKQKLAILLESLVQQNYWFLSSQELFDYFIKKSQPIPPNKIGKKPIMITFDDGYLGVHKNVFPILEKLEFIYQEKVRIVLFINPHYLGVAEEGDFIPHLSCEDLRIGHEKGFYDIQSHGLTHRDLTKLNSQNLHIELSQSQWALRKCLSGLGKTKNVGNHLAYPYGSSNRRVVEAIPKYYLTGYLYDDNLFRSNRWINPYELSRITVSKKTSVQRLMAVAKRSSKVRKKA